jgi:Regulator of chromosome condensation (RCC1) repeat
MPRFRWAFGSGILAAVAACGGGSPMGPTPNAPPGPSLPPAAVGPAPAKAPPAQGATQMDCGDFHTCARLVDGTVRCWGRNDRGQLGDGTTVDAATPVTPAGLRGVVEVAAGASFTCARLEGGAVQCWGSGRLLGDGIPRASLPPTAVPNVGGALEVRAAGLVTCARRADGARCWGLEGDRARAATSTDLPDLGKPVELATGAAHACGRQGDGSVRCWGDFEWTVGAASSFLRPALRGVRRLVTGDDFLCAIVDDGAVRCWGRNDDGQLGKAPDDEIHAAALEILGVRGAERLAAGEGQACAVLAGGTVQCWGANEEGELGLGTRTTTELPQPAVKGLSAVRDVCIGSAHACALTEGGAVHCWGANTAGQVGDGTKERRLTPTRVRGL